MLQEDAELRVGLWIDGGFEHWEEDVLQHFTKVGHKVPASEDVANKQRWEKKRKRCVNPTAHVVANGTRALNVLDPGHLDHPLKVWGEDSVLDEPAGQFGPLARVATIDGKTRLSVLVLGILQVTGYFLVWTMFKTI